MPTPTEPTSLVQFDVRDMGAAIDYGEAYLFRGDCLEVMRDLIATGYAGTMDAVICDPPYGIQFMGKAWDSPDTIAFRSEVWTLAMALLKPGGHLAAFGGSRTYHRLAVAVEDAGFEIRDQLMWVYGTGFPKSINVSKSIDRKLGAARKKKRIPASAVANIKARDDSRPFVDVAKARGYHETDGDEAATDEAAQWDGYGTALKPAHEPIVLARKPFKGTIAANVLQHGTGVINIDACRVELEGTGATEKGRYPANLLHDGSYDVEEAFAAFGKAPGQRGKSKTTGTKKVSVYGDMNHDAVAMMPRSDSGTASRFFASCGWSPEEIDDKLFHYSAKASKKEKGDSTHPTQKPVSLMRWLVRLLCPEGGVILDPFCGTGTTLEAALMEGRYSVGCEMSPETWPDVDRRVYRAMSGRAKPIVPLIPFTAV